MLTGTLESLFQRSSHVCDSHESCSRHCFSCSGALCVFLWPSCTVSYCLFTAVPGAASAGTRLATPSCCLPQALSLQGPCVHKGLSVSIFASRFVSSELAPDSSRLFHVEDCFTSSTLAIDSSRLSRRGLLPVVHFFVDSSRLCVSSFCSISPDGTCCPSRARLLLDQALECRQSQSSF